MNGGDHLLMITHDLGVIAEIARRVVEEASTLAIFESPKHPYTRGLLRSIPKLGDRSRVGRQRLAEIEGLVPSLYDLPAGCPFAPRCPEVMAVCGENMPELIAVESEHRVRCWLYEAENA